MDLMEFDDSLRVSVHLIQNPPARLESGRAGERQKHYVTMKTTRMYDPDDTIGELAGDLRLASIRSCVNDLPCILRERVIPSKDFERCWTSMKYIGYKSSSD